MEVEQNTAEKFRFRKKGKSFLLVLLVLILMLCAVAAVVWRHEFSTLASIKQLNVSDDAHQDGAVYQMTVSGSYYFEDFLAQGGASTDGELISFITDHMTRGLIPMTIEESNIGCSSFTATTENGDKIFARNYDFDKTNACIVYTNPGGGRHASVSTIDLQFIGIDPDTGPEGLMDKFSMLAAPYVPLDGVNDAGVACGIYMSYQGAETAPANQQTDLPDLTSTTMLRLILDYAGSIEEAVELVSAYDLHDSANTSFHYMVADAAGKSAVLEWVNATDSTDNDGSARKLNVIWSENTPYQVVTNYILSEGYYEGEPEDSMVGLDRYEYLTENLAGTEGIISDEDAAMDLLAAVGRRSWNPERESITVHSVVYNLTRRTAIWVGNEHFGEESYTYRIAPKE